LSTQPNKKDAKASVSTLQRVFTFTTKAMNRPEPQGTPSAAYLSGGWSGGYPQTAARSISPRYRRDAFTLEEAAQRAAAASPRNHQQQYYASFNANTPPRGAAPPLALGRTPEGPPARPPSVERAPEEKHFSPPTSPASRFVLLGETSAYYIPRGTRAREFAVAGNSREGIRQRHGVAPWKHPSRRTSVYGGPTFVRQNNLPSRLEFPPTPPTSPRTAFAAQMARLSAASTPLQTEGAQIEREELPTTPPRNRTRVVPLPNSPATQFRYITEMPDEIFVHKNDTSDAPYGSGPKFNFFRVVHSEECSSPTRARPSPENRRHECMNAPPKDMNTIEDNQIVVKRGRCFRLEQNYAFGLIRWGLLSLTTLHFHALPAASRLSLSAAPPR
jgi:hypothetical protein